MNLLILCAGYAQRLQGLTGDFPKALLPVAGKPVLDTVLRYTAKHPALKSVFIVTNASHFEVFNTWLDSPEREPLKIPVKLLNDGSTCAGNKLGAIGDLAWSIGAAAIDGDDLVVVAGDTLFSTSQEEFITRSIGKPCTTGTFDTGNVEAVKGIASVITAPNGQIVHFEEKPIKPESTVGGIALYYFQTDTLPLIEQYLAEGNNPDQAGHLIRWLTDRTEVYGIAISGHWIDIGTPESYQLAQIDKRRAESNQL
ncbi:MAG: NTP transferase domain-containing protein [Verrucomicrobiae bacterium]|nr:NTP transferase domain-containing protein [Verrucomicrobiae bacterium]